MADIFGGDGEKSYPVWSVMLCTVIAICSILTVLLLLVLVMGWGKGNFENMPDYGIGQRGDVIAAIPSYEETSLRQKVDQCTKPVTTSQLTGTRDVPVFFQDYDVEASRRSARAAVTNAREGFEGGRGEDELERALAGRN